MMNEKEEEEEEDDDDDAQLHAHIIHNIYSV
jgi:hypothetical protein